MDSVDYYMPGRDDPELQAALQTAPLWQWTTISTALGTYRVYVAQRPKPAADE